MIEEVMDHLNNHFEIRDAHRTGEFVIQDGTIDLPFLIEGQYFWIKDSVLNNGVYQYPCYDLRDETFTGMIIPLAVPNDFLKVVEDIERWQDTIGSKLDSSMLKSESWNGYSYTRAFDDVSHESAWAQQFNGRLKRWRKLKCF